MPHSYDRSDITDAQEKVRMGRYDYATQRVRNVKTEIEDHAVDYGRHKEEFDHYYDELQKEVEKSDPREITLINLLDEIGRRIDNMDDGKLDWERL